MKIFVETPRTIVREFCMDDAADLQAIFGDAEVMANVEPPYDLEKTKTFLQSFCIDRGGALACQHKEGGRVIGYILFNALEEGVYEIGWIFAREFWRQGFAYEACSALMEHAFEVLGAHKVFAEAIDNVKSVGMMKKLGMSLEGVQRQQTRDNDGAWRDLYFYGILKEEFKVH